MTNLPPAQKKVVKAMQGGAQLISDPRPYGRSWLPGPIYIHKNTIYSLKNRGIIVESRYYGTSHNIYTLTQAGKDIKL